MSEWQLIESAPRDGTQVMLYKNTGIFKVLGFGYWEGGTSFVSGWITRGFHDVPGNLGLANPSHWMPMPSPPEVGAKHGC
jgi:hypothetical protein